MTMLPLVAALVLGCPLDIGYTGPDRPVPRPSTKKTVAAASPKAEAGASPEASATPAVVATPAIAPARRDALLAALHEAFPAGRASRVTTLLGDASGVLSNNAASLISDAGGGIVSDNGGGIISNNGGTYRLAQAEPPPGTRPADAIEFFTAKTDELVYEVTAITEQRGRFRSFDRRGWDGLAPERRLEALVDEFAWDDVVHEYPYGGAQDKLGITYKLRKVTSKRVPFTDRIDSREVYRMEFRPGGVATTPIGWEIAFALDMPAIGETAEKADFQAIAGEKDLQIVPRSDGAAFSLPRNMTLTGKNARGTYTGSVVHGEDIETVITHAAADGTKSVLDMITRADGSRRHTVTAEAAGLRFAADLAADGTGTGRIEEPDGTKLGDVTWDAEGVGTIAFPDGEKLTVPLF
jgi:hypothetical protein